MVTADVLGGSLPTRKQHVVILVILVDLDSHLYECFLVVHFDNTTLFPNFIVTGSMVSLILC